MMLAGCLLPEASGQNYIKLVEESDLYFNQIIDRFPGGDLLIGDSYLGPLQHGEEHGNIVMARLDPCGQKVWAYSYRLSSGYLEVRDFIIRPDDEILAYGSYFNGLEEVLFLLRLDGRTGQKAVFRLYDPETTNGYFAYSSKAQGQNNMVFGLLVNPNTGLVAWFDDALFPVWAKKINPFDANGAAIIDVDTHIVARSGSYIFKMDQHGNMLWSWNMNITATNGPVQINNDYILVGHLEGDSFFFAVDSEGQLLWQSDLFPAVESSGALSVMANGHILYTYNCPDATGNQLCQIILTSDGDIIEQSQLMIEKSINSGVLGQSIDASNVLTIAGNANAFVPEQAEIRDFLIQFPLDNPSNQCLQWENFSGIQANTISISLDSAKLDAQDFELRMTQRQEAKIDTFLFPLEDLCDASSGPILQSESRSLDCEENWLVSLPDASYVWLDGSMDNPRSLDTAGIYMASNGDCSGIELEYRLEKENCSCQMSVPTAFSPNGDGINDELAFVSSCPLDAVQMKVFNRFGNLMFASNRPDSYWNGNYRQQQVPEGVYVVIVQYQWIDMDGQGQEGFVSQAVSLIR